MAVKERPAVVQSGDPLRATYEIKFAQHVFVARVESGGRIALSVGQAEPFGHIRLGSTRSGAIWLGDDCIGEFEVDEADVFKLTPVVDGRLQPDAVVGVDAVTYLLQQALKRGIVR